MDLFDCLCKKIVCAAKKKCEIFEKQQVPIKADEIIPNANLTYCEASLNHEQRILYNSMVSDSNSISLIQAGPGAGKSYTLLTFVHNMYKVYRFTVVIYKKDLLIPYTSYIPNERRLTIAKFEMELLGMNYFAMQSLARKLGKYSKISEYEFGYICLFLLKQIQNSGYFKLELLKTNACLIVDECTTMSKYFLALLLILLKAYSIKAIFCGDRYQHQEITKSKFYESITSFCMIQSLAKSVHTLTVNMRVQKDKHLIQLISFLAKFEQKARDHPIDDFMKTFLVSAFPKKFYSKPLPSDFILAKSYKEITNFMMPYYNEVPVAFYVHEKHTRGSLKKALVVISHQEKHKFLPYIPLIIGQWYKVQYLAADARQRFATLKLLEIEFISESDLTSASKLYFAAPESSHIDDRDDIHENHNLADGKIEIVKTLHNARTNIIFESHLLDMFGSNANVYNFPVYPLFILSTCKAQGITITGNMSLIVDGLNFTSLYVAISRVQGSEYINSMYCSNVHRYSLMAILNFVELIDTSYDLCQAIANGCFDFKHREFFVFKQSIKADEPFPASVTNMIFDFFESKRQEERKKIRAWLSARFVKHLKGASEDSFSYRYCREMQQQNTPLLKQTEIEKNCSHFEDFVRQSSVNIAISNLQRDDDIVNCYADKIFLDNRENLLTQDIDDNSNTINKFLNIASLHKIDRTQRLNTSLADIHNFVNDRLNLECN